MSGHPRFYAFGRDAKAEYKRRRMLLFADTLAEVGEVKATCKLIGIGQTTGTDYLKTMRAELGWQAQ